MARPQSPIARINFALIALFCSFAIAAEAPPYSSSHADSARLEIIALANKICSRNPGSAICVGSIKWPTEDEIKSHLFPMDSIDRNLRGSLFRWLSLYGTKLSLNSASLIVLRNMDFGDDWVISSNVKSGKYFQFIDGRSYTVVVETNYDFASQEFDTNSVCSNILHSLSEAVNIRELGTEGSIKIKPIRWDPIDRIFEAEIVDTNKEDLRILGGIKKDLIWANGKYIIVDLTKIRRPYYGRLGYIGIHSVGGIPHSDPRSFKRLPGKNTFDYKKELIRVFPWIPDSTKYWDTYWQKQGLLGGHQ